MLCLTPITGGEAFQKRTITCIYVFIALALHRFVEERSLGLKRIILVPWCIASCSNPMIIRPSNNVLGSVWIIVPSLCYGPPEASSLNTWRVDLSEVPSPFPFDGNGEMLNFNMLEIKPYFPPLLLLGTAPKTHVTRTDVGQ